MEGARDTSSPAACSFQACLWCTQNCYRNHSDGRPLAPTVPCFYKTMTKSIVTKEYTTSVVIPTQFMQDNNDRINTTVTLEGPSGQVWEVGLGDVHVGIKCFRAGWRAFSDDHYLEVGDVLIFRLIDYSYFTVQVFDITGCEKSNTYAARNLKDSEKYENETICKKQMKPRVKRIEFIDDDSSILNNDFMPHTIDKDDKVNAYGPKIVSNNTAGRGHIFSVTHAGLDKDGIGSTMKELLPCQQDHIPAQNQSTAYKSMGSAECPILLDGRECRSDCSMQSYYNYCHKKVQGKRGRSKFRESKDFDRKEELKIVQPRKYARKRKNDLIQVLMAQNLRKRQDKVEFDRETEKCPIRDTAKERARAAALAYRTNNPSVVNVMKISNVYYGFFLYINKDFAVRWLPKGLTTVNLVDSDGYAWQVRWLGVDHRGFPGLSAGWRVFSRYHGLEEGDALVLEVLKETEIRVHIFRVSDFVDNLDDNHQNQKQKRELEIKRKLLSMKMNQRKTPRRTRRCNGTTGSERLSLPLKVKDWAGQETLARRLSQESCILQPSEIPYQASEGIIHNKHEEATSMLAKEIKLSDLESGISDQVSPNKANLSGSQGQLNIALQIDCLDVDQLVDLAQCPASSLLRHVLHNGW